MKSKEVPRTKTEPGAVPNPAMRWRLAAMGALGGAILLAPIIAGGFLPMPAALVRALVLAAAGFLLTALYLGKNPVVVKTPLTIPILAYLAISALSLCWSISRYASAMAWLELLGECLFAFLLIQLLSERSQIHWTIAALAGGAAVVAMLGVQEYFLHAVSSWHDATPAAQRSLPAFFRFLIASPPEWRVYGPFFNPNILADFLIVTIPIAFARFLLAEERVNAMAFGFLTALAFSALLLTASKGALGALVVAMALFALLAWIARAPLGPRPTRRILALALALMVVGAVFVRPMLGRYRAATSSEAHSTVFRSYLWESTARIIKAHPFGTGIGTFEQAYPRYALVGPSRTAHEDYLQIASESGIPALLAFLWILATGARTVLRSVIERRRGRPARPNAIPLLMIGGAAAVSASALHSLVDYAWRLPATALAFWLAVGITQACAGTGEEKPVRLSKGAWALSLVVLLLLASLGLRIGVAATTADLAQDLERSGQYQAALDQRRSAVEIDPWNPENHHRLARLLPMVAEMDRALDEIHIALAAEPGNSRFRSTLARLLEKNGDLPGARVAFQQAAQLDPTSTDAQRTLAQFEESQGRPAEAEKAWRRIVEIENSPVGRWPALPELVDTNPIYAHAALARSAAKSHRWSEVARHDSQALKTLAAWEAAKQKLQYQVMREIGQIDPQQVEELATLRVNLLQELSLAYQQLGEDAKANQARRQSETLSRRKEGAK